MTYLFNLNTHRLYYWSPLNRKPNPVFQFLIFNFNIYKKSTLYHLLKLSLHISVRAYQVIPLIKHLQSYFAHFDNSVSKFTCISSWIFDCFKTLNQLLFVLLYSVWRDTLIGRWVSVFGDEHITSIIKMWFLKSEAVKSVETFLCSPKGTQDVNTKVWWKYKSLES